MRPEASKHLAPDKRGIVWTFGFRAVQMAALAIYVVAVLAFLRLRRATARPVGEREGELMPQPARETDAMAPVTTASST